MVNNRIDYYSLLYNFTKGLYDQADCHLADVDDGEPCAVKDAKEQVLNDLDNMINALQEFKRDIQKLSLKKLKEEYGY